MDAGKCIIREGKEADLPRLVKLYEAFLEETLSTGPEAFPRNPRFDAERVMLRFLRSRDAAALLAASGEELIGFACVEFRRGSGRRRGLCGCVAAFFGKGQSSDPVLLGDRGYIAHLFVAKARRRQGVGAALVSAAHEWAKKRGAAAVELNVLAANDAARKLYEKLGMSPLLVHYRMKL